MSTLPVGHAAEAAAAAAARSSTCTGVGAKACARGGASRRYRIGGRRKVFMVNSMGVKVNWLLAMDDDLDMRIEVRFKLENNKPFCSVANTPVSRRLFPTFFIFSVHFCGV